MKMKITFTVLQNNEFKGTASKHENSKIGKN
jgi:hypothetical protein